MTETFTFIILALNKNVIYVYHVGMFTESCFVLAEGKDLFLFLSVNIQPSDQNHYQSKHLP